jgi:small-conductance mechanosensitive channel
LLRRVFQVVTYVVTSALLLMQFEVVRSVGVSMLASAGIVGLVVGLAAQRSISTLLAGIQLSMTQQIRLGDSVVVEAESGTIEEISLTYVVVRLWDLRRMVVPITYFLDKPFQNWSKGSSEILGTVQLQVDYVTDVEAMRREVEKILEGEGRALWDGKTSVLHVTETSDRTLTLRVLLSAADPGNSWELRCLVRERLVALLQKNPPWMPRSRTQQVS